MARTKTITVNVTARDIKQGVRRDCYACPIARALLRRLKPKWAVAVGSGHISVGKPLKAPLQFDHATCHKLLTPPAASVFVKKFDAFSANTPKPFRFELKIPTKFLRC